MYKFSALINSILLLSTFTEIKDAVFNQDIQQLSTKAMLQTQNNGKNIVLRDVNGNGSLVTYEKTNAYDEWSFEVSFIKPALKFPEKSGIFLWYSLNDLEQISKENYGRFIGLMVGFEQYGLDTELIISAVTEENENEIVLRDVIPRKLLAGVKVITMKVICTKKNFKVELYEFDKLLYDTLRIYDKKFLDGLESGKLFSITSTYENVDIGKHYELTKVNLLKRIENESYNPYLKNSEYEHEINDDLEHSIADLDHFIRYIDHVFGKPQGSTLIQGVIGAYKEIKEQKEKIESLKEQIRNLKANLDGLPNAIVETELKVQVIIRKMNDLKYYIKHFDNHQKKSGGLLLFFAGCCILFVILYNYRKEQKRKKL
ncbi:hypothetical protein BDAP_000855 [Binucleata daphniae]